MLGASPFRDSEESQGIRQQSLELLGAGIFCDSVESPSDQKTACSE
jgi:hypothetical protein